MIEIITAICLYEMVKYEDIGMYNAMSTKVLMLEAEAISTDHDQWYMDFSKSLKKLEYDKSLNNAAQWVDSNNCKITKYVIKRNKL